jgi:hypothetical protein
MKNSPTWRVPPLDKQALLTLASTVLRAKLDAKAQVDDLRSSPDNVLIDDLRYWQGTLDRLETGHLWILDLITSAQP